MESSGNIKDDIVEELVKYADEEHHNDIKDILLASDSSSHYSIQVNALLLMERDNKITNLLIRKPEYMLKLMNKAFRKASTQIYYRSIDKVMMCQKLNIHVRLHALPLCSETYRTKMPKSEDFGKLLCVSATVTRTALVKMFQYEKEYQCAKCKFIFIVKADITENNKFVKPSRCPNPQKCPSFNFKPLTNETEEEQCRDYQEIRIQEQVQQLSMGTIPSFMWVILEDDLVDICKAGNEVLVTGVVKQRWQPMYRDQRTEIELVLKAWYVEVKSNTSFKTVLSKYKDCFYKFWSENDRHPLVARDTILNSFCPQVFGMYMVKLAVALILAGGVQNIDNSGTKVRGDSHMLLVGDPGTGKSQFLKYAAKISPRSVLTTGIGSTSAGLTVSAIRDSGEWQLEAGALVLSDGGVCCIDEFNSIREQDKASIHEAMEQQTVSVAKAGLVCKLNTKCSVIAATNPKGKLDPGENICINLGIASPLLSRFDLIMLLHDSCNEDWDRAVSSYILTGMEYCDNEDLWSIEKMQSYFSLIRTMKPDLTEDSNRILCRYYQLQRQETKKQSGRVTIRLLESLIRLAQAHARLMFRSHVSVQDAIVVVSLMDSSIDGSGLLESNNALHTLFPSDPQMVYRVHLKIILNKLKLEDIIERELQRLNEEEDNVCNTSLPKFQSHLSGNEFLITENNSRTVDETSSQVEKQLPSKYFSEKTKSLSDKLADKYTIEKYHRLNTVQTKPRSNDENICNTNSKDVNEINSNIPNIKETNSKKLTNISTESTEKKTTQKLNNSIQSKLLRFAFSKDSPEHSQNSDTNNTCVLVDETIDEDSSKEVQRYTLTGSGQMCTNVTKLSQDFSLFTSTDEDFDCLDFDLDYQPKPKRPKL
ncbi:DNA helicase MCM9 [Nymphon striatum]|nr:DNA helicase MCM9 [Nymphon striatum]